MKRRITSFIAIILSICLLLCSGALADAAELEWGISYDQVIKILGKPYAEKSDIPGNVHLQYTNYPISEFSSTLYLIFRDDYLFAKVYRIDDNGMKSVFLYFKNALEEKYGSALDNISDVADCFILIGYDLPEEKITEAVKQQLLEYKTWKPDDDTNIVLLSMSPDTNSVLLIYFQPKEKVPEKKHNTDGL